MVNLRKSQSHGKIGEAAVYTECWMHCVPARVFAIDLSICPDCGGRLRVIADVTRPDIIQKILEHLARQQAPPEFGTISNMATVH